LKKKYKRKRERATQEKTPQPLRDDPTKQKTPPGANLGEVLGCLI